MTREERLKFMGKDFVRKCSNKLMIFYIRGLLTKKY